MQQFLAVYLAGRPVAEDLPRPVVHECEGPLSHSFPTYENLPSTDQA